MTLFTSGRYAAVISTLALVVALGGTSYAAVKITGADVTDSGVTVSSGGVLELFGGATARPTRRLSFS